MNIIERTTKRVLHEKFSIAYDTITLGTELKSDLGFDSLDAAELVMELENEFKTAISDEEADDIVTVEDLVRCFEKRGSVLVR